MKKTLVKTKIVNEGEGITIYFWRKTFLWFGGWYPFGSMSCQNKNTVKRIADKITDDSVSEVLYTNFINATDRVK
jgi:hypothetical protein